MPLFRRRPAPCRPRRGRARGRNREAPVKRRLRQILANVRVSDGHQAFSALAKRHRVEIHHVGLRGDVLDVTARRRHAGRRGDRGKIRETSPLRGRRTRDDRPAARRQLRSVRKVHLPVDVAVDHASNRVRDDLPRAFSALTDDWTVSLTGKCMNVANQGLNRRYSQYALLADQYLRKRFIILA